ncbi:MAG: hypothetical protein IJV24_07005 [Prevotella sp.]|nr:hypothetical protein [Prevotella sp.]
MEQIFDHAMHLRKIGQDAQAKIYIVGCYCQHTKANSMLRQYWAQMRRLYNGGVWTYRDYVSFRNYYEMAARAIAHLFGRFAWYNTLT